MTEGETRQGEISIDIDYLINSGMMNYSDGDMAIFSSSGQANFEATLKLEVLTIAYVEAGTMQIDLNGVTLRAEAGDMLVNPPNSFINNPSYSEDYSAKVIALSYKAIQRSLLMGKDIWGIMAYVSKNPVMHLDPERKELIEKYYSLIKHKIDSPHGYYHKEIMQSLFHSVFYEIAAIIAPNLREMRFSGQFSQGELLFKKFIEMLATYDGSERSVKAYADRLCVTPKYLSTVCKTVSGKTALEWIHDFLADAITRNLKYTEGSIKEISDVLGFPNMSFFGKFVKTRFGMSPKEYRIKLQSEAYLLADSNGNKD